MLGHSIACLRMPMGDSLDRLFLHPRALMAARKIDFYDAINLVIYAKLPITGMGRGRELIAGFIQLDKSRFPARVVSHSEGEDFSSEYERFIGTFSYPVAPSIYEPLLERMVAAKESALPYFFHEHHQLVDRRNRAALFGTLHAELAGFVSRGDVILQLSDSERTHLMMAEAWMTAETLRAYLDHYGVTPWWTNEENLRSHTRLERLLLSDKLNLALSDSLETYDVQQLPSYLFGQMLLKRAPAPSEYARVGKANSRASAHEPHRPDGEGEKSHNGSSKRMERTESPAAPDAIHDKAIPPDRELPRSSDQHVPSLPEGISPKVLKQELGSRQDNFEKAMKPSQEMSEPDPYADETLMSKKEAYEFLGIAESTFDLHRKKYPDFPEEFLIGERPKWKLGDLRKWRDRKRRKASRS